MTHIEPIMDSRHYETVAQAIRYLRDHSKSQPSLKEVANALHLSEFHLQRIFTDWTGLSPKRFLQFLTKEDALKRLQDKRNILATAHDVGLSGSSRLHDLMISCEAMTPGEIKAQGKNLRIEYGEMITPFGHALIAWTSRGICYLAFHEGEKGSLMQELEQLWAEATLVENAIEATRYSDRIFAPSTDTKLHLLVRGTNFQIKVWEALMKTQMGDLLSYTDLSALANTPKAQRAVGSAMAANIIGFLIPCHRVIRESGELGNYRWGPERKMAIQAWEAGH